MTNVYVIKLNDDVLKHKKFRAKNPNHVSGRDCLYVGVTQLQPEERYKNHKDNHKAARFVREYGCGLLPDLYDKYNPMEYEEALSKEVELAELLREKGYAVWQN